MQYGLVVVWLATYLLLALAALPLAGLLFSRLADRGAAFAFPLALAVLGVVGYLVGHLAFGWPALLAGLAVLSGASLLVVRSNSSLLGVRSNSSLLGVRSGSSFPGVHNDARSLAGRRVEIDPRGYAEAAVVFAVAFLLLVAVRAVDPAVHPIAGEKFLDFGLLKSLLRTDTLPPEDMWFAGEPVQYYYGGHAIVALLSELTFTPAAYAYNLALAGLYATFVTAAWGLASNVAAASGGPRRLAGGLGAFFVGTAGNLATPARVVLWALPDVFARPLVGAVAVPEHVLGWTPRQFSYWSASRVIPLVPGDPESARIPTEFPLFAWLNGDLQAHMMSTSFLLLVAGLLFSYWLTPEEHRRTRRAIVFGAVPPVAGLLVVVNTWSFLTPAGLTVLALTFGPADPTTLLPERVTARLPTPARANGGTVRPPEPTRVGWFSEELARTGTAVVLGAVTIGIAALWVFPFWLGTASGRPIGIVTHRAPLGGLLLVHGVFLAAFVPYLGRRGFDAADDPRRALGIAVLAVLAVLVAWLTGFAAVGLFGPLVIVGWVLLRTREVVGYETALFVGGAGLVVLAEFLYVVEQAGPGRFNTVFKTYAQVWALWAPAAGVALAHVATRVPNRPASTDRPAGADRPASTDRPGSHGRFGRSGRGDPPDRWRRAGVALAVVLVCLSSMYAAFALPNHFARGGRAASLEDPTLDATAFVAVEHPGEAPAIEWIDGLPGQPNIVTAAPGGYYWRPAEGKGASAPASLTGVPTVLGWYHEIGYRGRESFRQRKEDVRTIYTGSTARQVDLLRMYEVEYVYVGPAERARYGPITVDRVRGVEVHERLGDVVIYRVEEEKLPSAHVSPP